MDKRIMNFDPALRLQYELIPVTLNSARVKRTLTAFIASTTLDEQTSTRLGQIQLARWYCDDLRDDVDLDIVLVVAENATSTRAAFERYGVGYNIVEEFDEKDVEAISKLALAMDADVVLSAETDSLRELLADDVMLVVPSVEDVLHNAEIHLKGFDIPWSFEFMVKMQPWTNFYSMAERSIFERLLKEWSASAAASPEVANKMRILVGHSLPALCFNRDRMEFYRQQDRWTDRNDIERQDFRFEYTTALNNFYVTMYSAIDLMAAVCVDIFGLEIPREQIYAISGQFAKRRKAVPGLDALFTGTEFWDMYKIPRLIRHEAAHSGPVTPQVIYTGEDDFTDEQLDEAAKHHGFYDDLDVLENSIFPLPDGLRSDVINMARFKAKLKLLGRPLKHAVVLPQSKGAIIYNPDPASDLGKFLAFVDRVLSLITPWDTVRPKIIWSDDSTTSA